MATSGNNLNSGTSSAVAELLPDPSQDRPDAAPKSADDLIASIADQQIDALISESGVAPEKNRPASNVAAELAVQATQELRDMAQKLSDEASADLVADLDGVATEAMLTTPPPPEAPPPFVEPASDAPLPATSASAASTVVAPAPASGPEPIFNTVMPLPALGTGPLPTPSDTEVNQAEIDALINRSSPVTEAAHEPPVRQSSAEAVARELAEDVRPVAAANRVPAIVVVPMTTRIRDAIVQAVMTVLTWVNFPVRGLSDNAREVMGIIAIVTLVNAMSLLLYLIIFR